MLLFCNLILPSVKIFGLVGGNFSLHKMYKMNALQKKKKPLYLREEMMGEEVLGKHISRAVEGQWTLAREGDKVLECLELHARVYIHVK